MINNMKKFFGINESFKFEMFDFTCILTILNVVCIVIGFKYASVFGLMSCGLCSIWNVKHNAHINSYITQIALIVLNIKFLM